MTDPRWTELVSAYVLGTLDPEERASFEQRLAADAALRAEVDAEQELMHALARHAPRHSPPASLKERIMREAAHGERRGGGAPGTAGTPDIAPARETAPEPAPAAPEPTPASDDSDARDPADASPTRIDRPGRAPRLPWLAAAAGIVVAVGLGVLMRRQQERADDLQGRLQAVEAQLQGTEAELADRDSLLATFLGPDVRVAVLSGTDQPPSARLFWNTASRTLLVAAFNLPPAPDGRTYQLWGIATGDNPVSLGTFQTAADGTVIVQRQAPAGADFDIGAVTEEPAGGSPQPTTAPFLVGNWTQE